MDAAIRQRVVMEILGHSQISMTSRYAHVLPQVMTDAADRIGQALWGLPRSGRDAAGMMSSSGTRATPPDPGCNSRVLDAGYRVR
jgi:hypothetical protein